MSTFEPIAIVGLGALIPGCDSYKKVWEASKNGKILLSSLEDVDPFAYDNFINTKPETSFSGTTRGGFVTNYQHLFNPENYLLDHSFINELDVIFKWSLIAAFEAISCLKPIDEKIKKRTGVILGNLSMPTQLFTEYAASVIFKKLLDEKNIAKNIINPMNRFMSGAPAAVIANAFGFGGDAFALDSACASGLYAIKLACDQLNSGESDLMLAGSISAVARPMLHQVFATLGALSPNGQSKPFSRDTNGILPAEGSSFIVLKRLNEAVNDNDKIFGVVRGIGLSNAGREGSFLAPSLNAETSCIKKAYEQAGIDPKNIPYVECHATGTVLGDSIEIQALKNVFGKEHDLTLSSFKSNVGHMMSNAGIGSLIRTLGCLNEKYFPSTPNAELLNDIFSDTNYKVLQKNHAWIGNYIAGVSSFGLGGSNGHIIVESYESFLTHNPIISPKRKKLKQIAIVGIGIKASFSENINQFANLLFNSPAVKDQKFTEIAINPKTAYIPPVDLEHVQGQQLLLLPAMEEALSKLNTINKENTGVYVGMGVDCETARYVINMRLESFLDQFDIVFTEEVIKRLKKKVSPSLDPSYITGILSHLVANRLSHVLDSKGPSFTTSCEEISGDMALKSAIAAIHNGEINTAVVGAVDLSNEAVHKAACADSADVPHSKGADAAVVLVLQELEYALADKNNVLAIITQEDSQPSSVESVSIDNIFEKIGFSHASIGLVNIAAAIMAVNSKVIFKNNLVLDVGSRCETPYVLQVINSNFMKKSKTWYISSYCDNKIQPNNLKDFYIFCFTGNSTSELIDNLLNDQQNSFGKYKLAFVCDKANYKTKKVQAANFFNKFPNDEQWVHDDIIFTSKPLDGKLALIFTGSASAYAGAIKDITRYFPKLIEYCQSKKTIPNDIPDYALNKKNTPLNAFEQTRITNILSQVHFAYLSKVLKIRPDGAIGLSQGETEALYAFDVWENAPDFLDDLNKIGLYGDLLSGQYKFANEFWGIKNTIHVKWENYYIAAPVSKVKELVSASSKVYILIIYTSEQCVIGGESAACKALLQKLSDYSYNEVFYNLIFHCPIVSLFKEQLYKLYSRKIHKKTDVKFYSNYFGKDYKLGKENISEAIIGQAISTINFPGVIEKAWDDGFRCFIELGPKSNLSTATNRILKDRSHIALPLDIENQNSYKQLLYISAYLWCLGYDVDLSSAILPNNEYQNICLNSPRININLRLPELELLGDFRNNKVENYLLNRRSLISEEVLLEKIHKNISAMQENYLKNQKNMLEKYHDLSGLISELIKK